MILNCTVRDDTGASVGMLVLQGKAFKTGSRGYYGQGKITIGGVRYQASTTLVEIGSKAASVAESKAE